MKRKNKKADIKQVFNPFLPSKEYIPDGEPHVFRDRVYLYGSHDRFNSYGYCLNDYVCYSAPVTDLKKWRYEGVIYKKTDDPINRAGQMNLFAPDVCCGADGRYYLYYVLSELHIISVAVCDTPAGKFQFYGYVRHSDGSILGEREGDCPQFDPAVLFENGRTYLYSGGPNFVAVSQKGSVVYVLEEDMLTIKEEAKIVVPSRIESSGTGFEGHEFFEASSIRKINDKYYFVYSSVLCHELCYAISDSPVGDFKYMGTIISACDVGIDDYKPKDMPIAPQANNHGGIECINGQYYIFYHRHTNNHQFSRQACAEPIKIGADGIIKQVKVSSCGLNGKPLIGKGEYSAYIACQLFRISNGKLLNDAPYLTMECNNETNNGEQFITNIKDGSILGFRSFDCKSISKISVKTAGFIGESEFEVALSYDGAAIGKITLNSSNDWIISSSEINIPDGVYDIYFRYKGNRPIAFLGFILE